MKTAKTTNNPVETGRPIGSTIYEKDEFIKKAKAAYKGFLKRNKNPSQTDMAGKTWNIPCNILPLLDEIHILD